MELIFVPLSSFNILWLLDHLSIHFREWIISYCSLSFSQREVEHWDSVQLDKSSHRGILGFSQSFNYSEALVNEVNYPEHMTLQEEHFIQ